MFKINLLIYFQGTSYKHSENQINTTYSKFYRSEEMILLITMDLASKMSLPYASHVIYLNMPQRIDELLLSAGQIRRPSEISVFIELHDIDISKDFFYLLQVFFFAETCLQS